MTGKSEPPWNWLHNVGIAAALAVAEATWVSLSLAAAANGSRSFHMDLPFLAVALPALVAVTVVGYSGRLFRGWWRAVALGPVIVCGVGLTAGLVSELSVAGSFGSVSLHPWTVVGRVPSTTAAIAWLVAGLAWGRGTWLGAVAITFTHAVRSVIVSVLAYLVLFAVLATNSEPALHRATRGAVWLFVAFFAAAAATLALVRERDLERDALVASGSRPSLAWLTVLGVPLAGVALLLAAAVGPLGSHIGRGVERIVAVIRSAIVYVGRAVVRLFPGGHTTRSSTHGGRQANHPPPIAAPSHPVHGSTHVSALAWEIVAVVVVLAALLLLVRVVHRTRLRWRPEQGAVEEERDSLYSFDHLLAQVWAAIRGLFRRAPRAHSTEESAGIAMAPLEPDVSDVRRQYRRLLTATSSVGLGRRLTETTHDFEKRLGVSGLPAHARGDLDRLTRLYDRVRYGGHDGTREDVLVATHGAEVVIEAIEAVPRESAARVAETAGPSRLGQGRRARQ